MVETSIIRCPDSGGLLFEMTRGEAEKLMGGSLRCVRPEGSVDHKGGTVVPYCERVLVREDYVVAYPVIDGIPILLIPEQLSATSMSTPGITHSPLYAEAYSEMSFYNEAAALEAENFAQSNSYWAARRIEGSSDMRRSFLDREVDWLDAPYDCAAQLEAYRFISPIEKEIACQIGGKGGHAVKFALAGASKAILVTPMLGEAKCARALAKEFGVEHLVDCVVAVAEQLPFADESIDVFFSGGCLHHTVVSKALSQIGRCLRKGGRLGTTDPWRAPLYAIGTGVLGKREPDVKCIPLDRSRLATLSNGFEYTKVTLHGAFTRYALLALQKAGLRVQLSTALRLFRLDDRVARCLGKQVVRHGSSVSIVARR